MMFYCLWYCVEYLLWFNIVVQTSSLWAKDAELSILFFFSEHAALSSSSFLFYFIPQSTFLALLSILPSDMSYLSASFTVHLYISILVSLTRTDACLLWPSLSHTCHCSISFHCGLSLTSLKTVQWLLLKIIKKP